MTVVHLWYVVIVRDSMLFGAKYDRSWLSVVQGEVDHSKLCVVQGEVDC